MNSQELRNLQEAYMDVYQELDEVSLGTAASAHIRRRESEIEGLTYDDEPWVKNNYTRSGNSKADLTKARMYKKFGKSKSERAIRRVDDKMVGRPTPKGTIEKVDGRWKKVEEAIELILLHLLDEGYTNSIEGAEVILENMSEGWIESIWKRISHIQ